MLRPLSVRNYVLIDSLEIDFPEGLIIITGQTGAGKSIILGALSLLMGARADASAISGGADSCVVEAEFDIDGSDEIMGVLEENDVEQDGGHLVIRRVVNRSGRSRSFVNDCPVNLQVLSRISSRLVDIHSQHQSLLLTDRQFQMSVLDHFAGNGVVLADCRAAWSNLQALKSELSSVESRLGQLEAERDYNESQFRQLEAAALRDGELEELEAEQRQLANAGEIKSDLCRVESAFDPQRDDVLSMDASLRTCAQLLSRVARFVPEAGALSDRLTSARIELSDILDEVSSINSCMDVSEDRLQAVEDRMSAIYDLLKKHSCRTVAELIEVRDRYGEALYDSTALEARKDELARAVVAATARHSALCASLHESRVRHSGAFAASIMDSLRFLELDRAVFEVSVADAPAGAGGSDEVTFLFSSTGQHPVDLAKCASGGEISRIMLSLKAMMAKFTAMPTMIFDEIDSGVSGSVADRMGSMICGMGADMQVFAITHLPQVAAKGDAHYLVSKSVEPDGRTVSTIRPLTGDERVTEVARMLSGAVITDAAIANARVLLAKS